MPADNNKQQGEQTNALSSTINKNKDGMMLTMNRLLLCFCAAGLSGCTSQTAYTPETTTYQPYHYEDTQVYPEGYESISYSGVSQEKKEVMVPETYHVGAYHSPTPHTNRDRDWVNTQSPQNYTIELADGDKASDVANALYKAPKSERMAEVKYQRGGKVYYKGLYGSYPSQEAAQQALEALPNDIKEKAGVKSWGSVQSNVTD